jgi:Haloacid dehalogenase-like hydrolase
MLLIQAGDFAAYPDALRFVIAVKGAGMLITDASSSKNAALFLRQIRLDTFAREHGISSPTLRPGLTLLDYFDADVSGRDFAHGKPDPELFLTAAHELGVEPRHAIVIKDASAGIQAAKAGSTAAIGVARAGDAGLLAAAGADLVVTTRRPPPSPKEGWPRERHYAARQRHRAGTGLRPGGRRGRLRPRQRAQIDQFGVVSKVMRTAYHNVPNGGSRATAAASDHHAARPALQSVSEPSADSARKTRQGG